MTVIINNELFRDDVIEIKDMDTFILVICNRHILKKDKKNIESLEVIM